ncbi:MAG: 50S ribosomal protein L18 [Candidatus Microgenomates bacterium]|jgi:large subunit ribosomal protein L18
MNTKERFIQRRKRVRAKIVGSPKRPRISVFKSNRYLYAQIIDDAKGRTLVAATEKELTAKATRMEKAGLVGELLAKKSLAKKIKTVVFDKGGYRYHGRVKALADGARKGGLEF